MSFTEDLKKSETSRGIFTGTRPEVLLLPQIPKPMHGLAPRVILGSKWWDETRYAAYKSTDYHCIACGIHKTEARGPKWLEGHEVYRTDYVHGRLVYLETVPLCHYCHNYIHNGRLQALLDKHSITQQRFTAIMQHGEKVLSRAGLQRPQPYEGPMAEWSKWRLVIGRLMYKPKFKSFEDWKRHFGANYA